MNISWHWWLAKMLVRYILNYTSHVHAPPAHNTSWYIVGELSNSYFTSYMLRQNILWQYLITWLLLLVFDYHSLQHVIVSWYLSLAIYIHAPHPGTLWQDYQIAISHPTCDVTYIPLLILWSRDNMCEKQLNSITFNILYYSSYLLVVRTLEHSLLVYLYSTNYTFILSNVLYCILCVL